MLPAPGFERENSSETIRGSQAIHRAFEILRAIADAPFPGLRLADVAERIRMSAPTCHRILKALVHEGMVEQDRQNRRYRLGNGYLQLGRTARRNSLQTRLHLAIERLAAEFSASVFLSIRMGNEMLCIDRATGSQPIQIVPYGIGERRVMGVGAASIAMLALDSPGEAHAAMARNAGVYARYGLKPADIAALVEDCRKRGFAFNPALFIPGVAGIGVAALDAQSGQVVALNITALESALASPVQQAAIGSALANVLKAALG